MIHWISSVSVVLSPFPFPILLIWIFSHCLLVNLGKSLLILLNFSMNQFFVSLTLWDFDCCYWLVVFILLISGHLLLLGVISSILP